MSRRLNRKESGPISILELQNDGEELWCSGLTGFFLDTLRRAALEDQETLQAEPAENQKEL